jgi:hypothetical protein
MTTTETVGEESFLPAGGLRWGVQLADGSG